MAQRLLRILAGQTLDVDSLQILTAAGFPWQTLYGKNQPSTNWVGPSELTARCTANRGGVPVRVDVPSETMASQIGRVGMS